MLCEILRTMIVICVVSVAPMLAQAQAPRSPTPAPVEGAVRVETVARGLEHPWGLAFLPDGRMLVTERPGRLRSVEPDGRVSEPLTGVPEVFARGQGGLLDVALSPNFAQDGLVYLSFSEPGEGGAGTAVARGRLGTSGLDGTQVIWHQQPKVSGNNHWGSRLVFPPRRHAVCDVGRSIRLSRAGAGPLGDDRQDRADQPGRLGAAR